MHRGGLLALFLSFSVQAGNGIHTECFLFDNGDDRCYGVFEAEVFAYCKDGAGSDGYVVEPDGRAWRWEGYGDGPGIRYYNVNDDALFRGSFGTWGCSNHGSVMGED